MSAVIDEKRYKKLLVQKLPHVIASSEEHTRLSKEVQAMMMIGDKLTVEERELMRLLIVLVHDYESRHFRDSLEQIAALDVLEHLMEAHNHTPKDLWKVIGDKGTVSKILKGERQISKAHAKRLGDFYHVSPSVFI